MKRRQSLFLLGALAAAVGAAPAAADVPCPPFLPACAFSVSGKRGPYLKQVDPQKLLASDAALKAPTTTGGKGLGEHSINEGQIYDAGLYMPETKSKLEQLLAVIRAQWPYADPGPIQVRLIARTTYGPNSRPDNTMLVPLGLLERAQSDDEVMWVLAHEFSHLALRHFVRTAELEQRKRGMDRLVTALTTGFALSQVRANASGQVVHFYAVSDPHVQQRTDSTEAWQNRIRTAFVLRDYASSRDQEDQADATGADLAIAAGYAADDGAAQAIDRISDDDAEAAKTAKSLQAQMQQIAQQSLTAKGVQAATAGNLPFGAIDFMHNFGGNAMAVLADRTINYLSDTHRAGPARRKGLSAYIMAAYPNLPDRPLRTTWLHDVKATPEFKDAAAAATAHDMARNDLDNNDLVKAGQDIQGALKTSFAGSPFVLDIAAEISAKSGDVATADKLYDRAETYGLASAPPTSSPPHPSAPAARPPTPHKGGRKSRSGTQTSASTLTASPMSAVRPLPLFVQQDVDGYKAHVDLLASHGQYDKASMKIAEAEQRFGDHETLLPEIIFVSLKTNKPERMMAAFGECQDTEAEGLILLCREAILDEDQKKQLDQLPPAQHDKVERMLAKSSSNVQRANWWSQTTKGMTSPGNPSPANP